MEGVTLVELSPTILLGVVLLGLLALLLIGSRLATWAAHLGIWITGRLAGRERLYGEDRADEGRMARHGRARTVLAPRGKVFVSGELWEAELAEGESPVDAGEGIEVLSREGLLLRVRPVRENRTA